jgi:hypothetical protein
LLLAAGLADFERVVVDFPEPLISDFLLIANVVSPNFEFFDFELTATLVHAMCQSAAPPEQTPQANEFMRLSGLFGIFERNGRTAHLGE